MNHEDPEEEKQRSEQCVGDMVATSHHIQRVVVQY